VLFGGEAMAEKFHDLIIEPLTAAGPTARA
jgi:hypothetical protein